MLKKILSLLLAAGALMVLPSCGSSYKSNNLSTVMKVGSHNISYDTYNYFYMSNKSDLDQGDDSYWKGDDAEEKENNLRSLALNNIRQICAYEDLADENDISLSSDVKDKIKAEMKEREDSYGSREAYEAMLKKYNLTEQLYYELLCNSEIQNELYSFLTDEYTGNIKSDDATVKTDIQNNFSAAVQILIKNDEGDDAETNRKLAQDIYQRILNGEDFYSLAKQFTEDKNEKSYTDGYYFTSGEMLEFFEKAVSELKPGEMSKVTESSLGFHIIMRVPLNDEYIDNNLDTLRESYLTREFNTQIETKAQSYEITYKDLYNTFSPDI